MSNLEDKLNASLQAQRRRPGTRSGDIDKAAPAADVKKDQGDGGRKDEVDLNAGGGRGVNPPRVWPD